MGWFSRGSPLLPLRLCSHGHSVQSPEVWPTTRSTPWSTSTSSSSPRASSIQDFLRCSHCCHFPLLWDAQTKCVGYRALLRAVKSWPASHEWRELIRSTWGQGLRPFLLGSLGSSRTRALGGWRRWRRWRGWRHCRRASTATRCSGPSPTPSSAHAPAPALLPGRAPAARALPAQPRRRRLRAHRRRAPLTADAAASRAAPSSPGSSWPARCRSATAAASPLSPRGSTPGRPTGCPAPREAARHSPLFPIGTPTGARVCSALARRRAVLPPLPARRAAACAPLCALRDAAHVGGAARAGGELDPGPEYGWAGWEGEQPPTRDAFRAENASSLLCMPSMLPPPSSVPPNPNLATQWNHQGGSGKGMGPGPTSTVSDSARLGCPQTSR